ncbi:MAG: RDD family protein [Proteobacteria bacterium]|nr:RDD family protein [Pseudomonadota bacterium]
MLVITATETQAAGPVYAGFWKRVLAAIVDGILINIPIAVVTYLVAPEAFGATEGEPATGGGLLVMQAVSILVWMAYKGFMEGGASGATIGKRLLSIKVTRVSGGALGVPTAIYRAWPYWVPAAATLLGPQLGIIGLVGVISCIVVAFTAKKQGLHDMMAKCLVVRAV